MVRSVRLLALLVALLGWLAPTRPVQAAEVGRFIVEHLAFEAAAVGGWRASWADDRSPGFHLAGGGGEVNIGLELDNGLGILIGGRTLIYDHLGRDSDLDGMYLEALGQILGQFRLSDWVRLGLGATAGRVWRCCGADVETPQTSSLLFGGFLRVGVDFLPRNSLPRALSLWLRIGIDGHRTDAEASLMPTVSMNIAVGIGIRL